MINTTCFSNATTVIKQENKILVLPTGRTYSLIFFYDIALTYDMISTQFTSYIGQKVKK